MSAGQYAKQLFSQVQAIPVSSRAQALAKVSSGDVVAAVVIPSNIASRVESATSQAELDVIYNGDALQQAIVQSEINAAVAQANLGFSEQIQRAAASAIGVLLRGGNLGALGASGNFVGLEQIPSLLHRVIARQPPGPDRRALEQVAAFAGFAAQKQ